MESTIMVAPERTKRPEKTNVDTPLEAYPPVLQARHIRDILGISEGKAYEVLNSRRCPTIRLGKRMVVMKDSFLKFLYDSEGDSILDDGMAS